MTCNDLHLFHLNRAFKSPPRRRMWVPARSTLGYEWNKPDRTRWNLFQSQRNPTPRGSKRKKGWKRKFQSQPKPPPQTTGRQQCLRKCQARPRTALSATLSAQWVSRSVYRLVSSQGLNTDGSSHSWNTMKYVYSIQVFKALSLRRALKTEPKHFRLPERVMPGNAMDATHDDTWSILDTCFAWPLVHSDLPPEPIFRPCHLCTTHYNWPYY